MANWHPIQNSFHVGEVSARISMRQDIEQYKQAASKMLNWMTNPQGTAERVAGTRFLSSITTGPNPTGRVIAFKDANDIEALLILLPTGIEVRTESDVEGDLSAQPDAAATATQNVVTNASFKEGGIGWDYNPLIGEGGLLAPADGGVFFNTFEGKSLAVMTEVFTSPNTAPKTEYLKQTITIGAPTDSITYNINGTLKTVSSFLPESLPPAPVSYRLKIYAADGVTLLGQSPAIEPVVAAGTTISANRTGKINIGVGYTGNLVVSMESVTASPAAANTGTLSTTLSIDSLIILASSTKVLEITEVPEDPDVLTPYTAAELKDVQYVQSPYAPTGSDVWKELVLVHPNHPPRRLYWSPLAGGGGGAYVYDELPFYRDDPDPAVAPAPVLYTPPEWGVGAYPASCSSYQGRLVLGGGGSNGEDIILSVSSEWGNLFNIELNYNPASVYPSSAVKFTTTFRSATRWVAGQKELFIGSSELEYKISSDGGILRAGDIDARVQTSHGSINVQPVSMGDELVFPAENGRKMRGLEFTNFHGSYVAKDLTLLHPFILSTGVVRMVRLRNPHQILLVVLTDGTVAMLNYEPTVGLVGWSRMKTSGNYIDVTVATDDVGNDVPVFLIQRKQTGVTDEILLLEAITQWEISAEWHYMDSYIVFDNVGGVNVFEGLGHLEGRRLNVMGDGAYLGDFEVVGGEITLVDGYGEPIIPDMVVTGLPKWSHLVMLPPIVDSTATGGIGAFKRYNSVGVRLRNSHPPIINGVRPPDRAGDMTMDRVAGMEDVEQHNVTNLGYDEYQQIEIAEILPVRCEIIGVYGDLGSNSL